MIDTKRIATLLAGVAIVVAACGGTASPSPSTEPSTAASSAPASVAPSEEPTLSGKLTVWHAYGSSGGSAEFRAFTRILEDMKLAYPDLEIEAIEVPFSDIYRNFEAESGAGGGPDMFIAPNDSLGAEVRGGYLADLTGKIDLVLDNSIDVAVAGSQVAGAPYMVPESLKAVAMYYDSAIVTDVPTTTDELLAYVQGGGKVGLITGAYFGWGFYSAFGGAIFDENGKCAATANSGIADAIAYVKALRDAGALVDPDYGKVNNAFLSGDIDIMLNGNWTLGDYKAARPALAVGPVVSGPAGPARTMAGVDGWYINAASPNAELAIAVAAELVNFANQRTYVDIAGHVPANKDITVLDPLVKGFTDAILQGDARPQTEEFNNYWGPFGDAWNKAIPADGSAGGDPAALVAEACTLMDTANNK
jgi:arabinogalactan oligomer/maltooligosaccharide transport system substrate-binding protein